MHNVASMHSSYSRTHLSEYLFLDLFRDVACFDFFEECPSVDVLQHHISYILFFLVEVVQQPHYVGMLQLCMHRDLFSCVFVVYLGKDRVYEFNSNLLPGGSIPSQLNLSVGSEANSDVPVVEPLQKLVFLLFHCFK